MRTLVQNYTSSISTESMYFHRCLKEAGCDVELWVNPQVSTFDMFDSFRPDIFICHYEYIKTDIVKYLSGTNIEIVPNVTGANKESLGMIEKTFSDNRIKCPFMFTNFHHFIFPVQKPPTNIELITILPGLDIFLPRVQIPMFKLGTAFISTKESKLLSKLTKKKDTYHKLCVGKDDNFDLSLNIKDLISVLDKYEECIIVDDIFVAMSQLFFETTFAADKAIVKVEEQFRPTLEKMWAVLFHEEDKSKKIGEIVKEQIKQKHTCFNRTAKLAKHLGHEELSNKLISMGESL